MSFAIDIVTVIVAIVSGLVGAGVVYAILNEKDRIALSILRASEAIMDEFGEDIKSKDEDLYNHLTETLVAMRNLLTEGYSLGEFIKFMNEFATAFKGVIDVYDVDDWIKEALDNVKNK